MYNGPMRDKLCTRKIGPKLWEVTKDFTIPSLFIDGRWLPEITTPSGFITDGASNIRPLWSIMPPMSGNHAEAAVPHDYLYSVDSRAFRLLHNIDQKIADLVFLAVMEMYGTSWAKRKIGYRGVRMFGASSFDKKMSIEKKVKGAYPDIIFNAKLQRGGA